MEETGVPGITEKLCCIEYTSPDWDLNSQLPCDHDHDGPNDLDLDQCNNNLQLVESSR